LISPPASATTRGVGIGGEGAIGVKLDPAVGSYVSGRRERGERHLQHAAGIAQVFVGADLESNAGNSCFAHIGIFGGENNGSASGFASA
jgi:hypothetical protein